MLQTRVSEKSQDRPRSYRSKVERRRFNGNTAEGRRIQALENQYKAELGEVSAVPAVAQEIRRVAELVMLGEKRRAKMIRDDDAGGEDFEKLLRLEGVVGRALDRMRALAAQARAEAQSAQSYDQFFAFTRTGRVEPWEPHEAAGRGGATPSPRHAPGGRRRARQRASCDDEEG